MSEPLLPQSDKEAIHERALFLVNKGITLKDACKKISKETGKSHVAVKKIYQRQGGNPDKDHGCCKLTKEEENIILSVVVVYSLLHLPLTKKELQKEVKNLFGFDVSYTWAQRFIQRHSDEIKAKKNKAPCLEKGRQ